MAQAQAAESFLDATHTLSEAIDQVATHHQRLVITRDGQPQGALVSLADLELLRRLDRSRVAEVVEGIRARSDALGPLSKDEINEEIRATRKARSSLRPALGLPTR